MKKPFYILFFSCLLTGFFSCNYFSGEESSGTKPLTTLPEKAKIEKPEHVDSTFNTRDTASISAIEQKIISAGLVDIQTIDSGIVVELKYSTCDNFLFMDLYGSLSKAYLQPDVAGKLKNAQALLRSKFPYYSLIVYDAVRPRSIQHTMWDTIAVPYYERSKYVSNPQNGSLHNFGAAVDLSIIDENGVVLDMGTPYDFFGELAYPREEQRMIREGKLSYKQLFNREILRDAMLQAGFAAITTEWWHFNSCSRNEAVIKYKIVE